MKLGEKAGSLTRSPVEIEGAEHGAEQPKKAESENAPIAREMRYLANSDWLSMENNRRLH